MNCGRKRRLACQSSGRIEGYFNGDTCTRLAELEYLLRVTNTSKVRISRWIVFGDTLTVVMTPLQARRKAARAHAQHQWCARNGTVKVCTVGWLGDRRIAKMHLL